MDIKIPEVTDGVIRIVPFCRHHITERYVSWLNDPDVVRYSEQRHKKHTLQTAIEYHDVQKNTNNYILAIEKTGDELLHVGNLRVLVNTDNNWASLSISVGDKEYWGTGVGSRAWILMLETLLDVMNYRMVIAGTMEVNEPMISLMKRSGMIIDCVLPRRFMWEGRETGLVWASISR